MMYENTEHAVFVEPEQQWVVEDIRIEKILMEFDEGGVIEMRDIQVHHYLIVYIRSIVKVFYYYFKQFSIKNELSTCQHMSSILLYSGRGGYELDHFKKIFNVKDMSICQINGFNLVDFMKVKKISLRVFLISVHQSILTYFSVLKNKLPQGAHYAILQYGHNNIVNYSFFDVFFNSLKKEFPDCVIYTTGVTLPAYATIKHKLKTIQLHHGLISKIDLNVYPRYSEIYVYSNDEKEYLDDTSLGSIVRIYHFDSAKRYDRLAVLILPTMICGDIGEGEILSLINTFRVHGYTILLRRHPLKSSWDIQTWKKKINFTDDVYAMDSASSIQDAHPSFVISWTSTVLCEALNMKIIPISMIELLNKKAIGPLNVYRIRNRSLLWPSEKNIICKIIENHSQESYNETLEMLRSR